MNLPAFVTCCSFHHLHRQNLRRREKHDSILDKQEGEDETLSGHTIFFPLDGCPGYTAFAAEQPDDQGATTPEAGQPSFSPVPVAVTRTFRRRALVPGIDGRD